MANQNVNEDLVEWLTRVLPIKYREVMTAAGARLKQESSGVYHERQRQHHDVCTNVCILHALNNLLQGEGAFTRRELAGITARTTFSYNVGYEPTWWSQLFLLIVYMMQKRHRSFESFLDYSTTLFMAALARRHKMVDLYDPELIGQLPPMASYGDRLMGILLSSQQPISGRHWVAMRMVGRHWYNLDSLLPEPYILPNGEEDLKLQMDSAFGASGRVLIVLKPEDVHPLFWDVNFLQDSDPALSRPTLSYPLGVLDTIAEE